MEKEKVDITEPSKGTKRGALHPLTRFNNKFIDLCVEMGFTVIQTPEIETDYRNAFIKGAISFAKDYKSDYKDKFDGRECFGKYVECFNMEYAKAKQSEAESSQNRPVALMVCVGALVGLIQFLFIPLLIQIEENTRK
jgi:hypothetical protein